jgi:hypothetical protein
VPFLSNELKDIIKEVCGLTGFEAIYAQPRAKFFPSVDAIIIPKDGIPIFLQYTIRDDHSLKMFGVWEAWEQLQQGREENDLKRLAGGPLFYFVVPTYRTDFKPKLPEYSPKNMDAEKRLLDEIEFGILYVDYGEW